MRRFIVTAGSGFAFAFLACAVPAGGAAAAGIELPPHRPGLWEMSMALDGKGQGLTMQRCTDAETDDFITSLASGFADQMCSRQETRREGGRILIESDCAMNGTRTSARAEINGSFDDAYTMSVTTKAAGLPGAAGALEGERRITVTSRWLGKCAAGQKPGDLILPGGIKMNVRNIRGIMGLIAPR